MPNWLQTISKFNPISYGIDGMRTLIISGFDPNKVFPAIIVPGTIAALCITGATLNVSQPRRMNQ